MNFISKLKKYKAKIGLSCLLAAVGIYSLSHGITMMNILYFAECLAAIGFVVTLASSRD